MYTAALSLRRRIAMHSSNGFGVAAWEALRRWCLDRPSFSVIRRRVYAASDIVFALDRIEWSLHPTLSKEREESQKLYRATSPGAPGPDHSDDLIAALNLLERDVVALLHLPSRSPRGAFHAPMADGASALSTGLALIGLQLLSRLLTFSLNQALVRLTTPEALGLATIQFEVLLNTILFLSREGIRGALVRRAAVSGASVSVKP